MISFWEKDALLDYDYGIIGSGILGLSTAIELKSKQPKASVVILERSVLPTGASTKNAGFACFAKACEMLSDAQVQGLDASATLAHKRYLGLEKLRKRLGDQALDFHSLGGYELIREEDDFDREKIEALNEALFPHFDQRVFEMRSELISTFGFKGIKELVFNKLEGQIHSGKMIDALWRLANELGIRVITGANVKKLERNPNPVALVNHQQLGALEFRFSKLAICTNALANKLYPQGAEQSPGRGQVLVTSPIPKLPFKGTFHFDEGYFYFRNYQDRILFGGGRNIDTETENTDEFAYNQQIQQALDEFLKTMIAPELNYSIDMRWMGIMGFTYDKTPRISNHGNGIFSGFTCNGMGIALGSESASELAGLILNDE